MFNTPALQLGSTTYRAVTTEMRNPIDSQPIATWLAVALLLVTHVVSASEPLSYNRDVLPLLAENCFVCHGFDKGTRQAGLRLDRADAAMQPLADGLRAIVPGEPARSELIQRLTVQDPELRMPPAETGKRLTDRDVAILTQWIAEGARYETHWAFIPPSDTASNKSQTLRPATSASDSARANRLTLLRRLSLDLTGLPPTAELVRSLAQDQCEDAIERAVDRLLASPRFGEHFARWWLDLAHYADSDGYLQDFLRPHAWHYRDWVLNALNDDMPFDKFTTHQLAGDLLADIRQRELGIFDIDRSDAESKRMRIATGFLRNTLSNREGGADLEEYRVRQAIDRTATLGTTWLGLTIGCAECHDHKYDPISQVEFYQLYALLNDIDEVNIDLVEEPDAQTIDAGWNEYYRWRTERLSSVAVELEQLQRAWEEKLLWTEQHPGADHRWDRQLEVLGLIWGQGEGEGQLEGINIIKTAPDKRTRSQKARLQDYFFARGSAIDEEAFKRLNVSAIHADLQKHAADLPKVARAQTIVQAIKPRKTFVHMRGDFRRPGVDVAPSVPAALAIADLPVRDRLSLAQWLTNSKNPLVARVAVNRLWQQMFGVGLVPTSENFGIRGTRPADPELLDHLAMRLIDSDWSIKTVLREIVLSEAYQQSTEVVISSKIAEQLDRASRAELLHTQPSHSQPSHSQPSHSQPSMQQRRLRLSAESVRDAMLMWGGLLDSRIGGPSVRPPQPESVAMEGFDNKWTADAGANRYRRGLYTFLQRTSPFAQSITFDLPDTSRSCSRRERSNTPLQALTLLNDAVSMEAALGAARVVLDKKMDSTRTTSADEQRIEELFVSILARWPTSSELARVVQHLNQQRSIFGQDSAACDKILSSSPIPVAEGQVKSEWAAWAMTTSVLMNLDEAITRN